MITINGSTIRAEDIHNYVEPKDWVRYNVYQNAADFIDCTDISKDWQTDNLTEEDDPVGELDLREHYRNVLDFIKTSPNTRFAVWDECEATVVLGDESIDLHAVEYAKECGEKYVRVEGDDE